MEQAAGAICKSERCPGRCFFPSLVAPPDGPGLRTPCIMDRAWLAVFHILLTLVAFQAQLEMEKAAEQREASAIEAMQRESRLFAEHMVAQKRMMASREAGPGIGNTVARSSRTTSHVCTGQGVGSHSFTPVDNVVTPTQLSCQACMPLPFFAASVSRHVLSHPFMTLHTEIDAVQKVELDKAWDKRVALWEKEQEARERLMAEVLHERKLQV